MRLDIYCFNHNKPDRTGRGVGRTPVQGRAKIPKSSPNHNNMIIATEGNSRDKQINALIKQTLQLNFQ